MQLSAFNLCISLSNGKRVPVECAYQAGKVFEQGGPYKDLLFAPPSTAKRDQRLRESGHVIEFDFEDSRFPTQPQSLFYTWLYIHALAENKDLADQLQKYNAFTDIVFNPNKSIITPAIKGFLTA